MVVLSLIYTLNEIFYSKLNDQTGILDDKYRVYGYINSISFEVSWVLGIANFISINISKPFK